MSLGPIFKCCMAVDGRGSGKGPLGMFMHSARIGEGLFGCVEFQSVTDRPVLPRPYRRRVPKGVVTVLEGARVLARGTRSCT